VGARNSITSFIAPIAPSSLSHFNGRIDYPEREHHPCQADRREEKMTEFPKRLSKCVTVLAICASYTLAWGSEMAAAQDVRIVKTDIQIDALDPGIKLFMREKMADGNTRFSDDNIVLFLHGATAPSTCDFDLSYKNYSWAGCRRPSSSD
jgi:hypothetical protein